MTRLLDISPTIDEQLAVWPGDVRYRRIVSMSIAAGDHLELSSLESTFHLGAHADAPCHYIGTGAGIGERALDYYYGRCQVVDVTGAQNGRIRPANLAEPIAATRLLLRTGSYPDPGTFSEDFLGLSAELVEHAHAQGVILIGIDTPSVDPFDDKALESHQALARHDMANLEGLVLEEARPGFYTLIALPLRIPGADASPVRAVLAPA